MVSAVFDIFIRTSFPSRDMIIVGSCLTVSHLVEGLLERLNDVWDMDCLKALIVLMIMLEQMHRCGEGTWENALDAAEDLPV